MKKKIKIYATLRNKSLNNHLLTKKLPQINNIPRDKVSADRWVDFKRILNKNNIYISSSNKFFLRGNYDFEFHFCSNINNNSNKLKYCILPEISFIDKECRIELLKKNYHKIFTNIKSDVDNKKSFYVNWPFKFNNQKIYTNKKNFLCMISSNKNLNCYTKKSGYILRAKLIKWFIKNHPDKLDLYGEGWNYLFSSNYFLNRFYNLIRNKLFIKIKINNPCSKGIYKKSSHNLIKTYKFMICFENVINVKGYSGGAMFDALYASTIPVFIGRPDIYKVIPKNCFIDLRDFKNFNELYCYLKNMPKTQYERYLFNINRFLKKKNNEYSIENLSKVVLKQLNKDIKLI